MGARTTDFFRASTMSFRDLSTWSRRWLPSRRMLLLGRERQQRDVARLLDRIVQLALVLRTHTRYPPRHDLRAFGNELRKQFHIFVVDGVDAFDAELTKLLPAVILFLSRRSFFSG